MNDQDATPWLTKAEAARRAKMSKRTLDLAMANGELKHSGGGGSNLAVRIHIDDLDAWVASRGTSVVAAIATFLIP